MITFINKIITLIIVPIMTFSYSPVMLVMKQVYKETEVVSLSDSGLSEESKNLKITAHRGVTAVAPENTVPAYKKACEIGFYAAEFDIRLTTDNHWVLSHNPDVNHRFWQYGNIEETDLATLKTYSYKSGSNFWAYGDLRIPTLEEVLVPFVGSNTHPQIHIKTEEHYDMLYTIVDILKENNLLDKAQIVTEDIKQLEVLHKLAPELELWLIVETITTENIAQIKQFGDKGWFTAYYDKNTPETIKLAIDNDVNVSYGTFSSVEDIKQAYDYGVRYIETDNICN